MLEADLVTTYEHRGGQGGGGEKGGGEQMRERVEEVDRGEDDARLSYLWWSCR